MINKYANEICLLFIDALLIRKLLYTVHIDNRQV